MVSILAFLVLITVLVFIHELGHFWVARLCSVRVLTFSVGFGPELFGRTDRQGTRWSFALIPLGGYVKMYGDTPESGDKDSPDAFRVKSVWQRFAIVVAGPLANFLLAFVLMTGLFSVIGQLYTPARVGGVVAGSPAAEAGFLTGDLVTALNGSAIDSFTALRQAIQLGDGTAQSFTILRDRQSLTLIVQPVIIRGTDPQGRETLRYQVGLTSVEPKYKRPDFVGAMGASFNEIWSISTGSLKAIKQIVDGFRPVSDLGGPIRIAQISGDAARSGLPGYLWTMAILSVSLGLLNLLPIPVLDGGHLFFYLVEIVRGRPLSPKIQDYCFRTGLILLLGFMVVVTWNDAFYAFFSN